MLVRMVTEYRKSVHIEVYGTPDSVASPRSLIQLREAALQADAYSMPVPTVGSSLVRLLEAESEGTLPFVTLP